MVFRHIKNTLKPEANDWVEDHCWLVKSIVHLPCGLYLDLCRILPREILYGMLFVVPRSQGCRQFERLCMEYKHVDFSQDPIVGLLHERGMWQRRSATHVSCQQLTRYRLHTRSVCTRWHSHLFRPFFLVAAFCYKILSILIACLSITGLWHYGVQLLQIPTASSNHGL